MNILQYDNFVRETNRSAAKQPDDRAKIALYGLVGEIGSLLSAVKKQTISDTDTDDYLIYNAEIIEEIGDIIWYCFATIHAMYPDSHVNVFFNNISFLNTMASDKSGQYEKFQRMIGSKKIEEFIDQFSQTSTKSEDLTFDKYQNLAIITARTEGKALRETCLAILWQHAAELLRTRLSDEERDINPILNDRKAKYILGDIAWHVSAVAYVYKLSLNSVVEANIKKLSSRRISTPTPLHDQNCPENQRFPRKFEIVFISTSQKHCRMYYAGKRLGDELTDNSHKIDGYRFHDIMHLANVAKLGWSPVLRDLMKLKRKYDKSTDEIEDGARAKIVEEVVIKYIHTEGQQILANRRSGSPNPDGLLFRSSDDISFSFLKSISKIVSGHEVQNNQYWEWEAAILDGYKIFQKLAENGQGTVRIDLQERTILYEKDVFMDHPGRVAGLGTHSNDIMNQGNIRESQKISIVENSVKLAILKSLNLTSEHAVDMDIVLKANGGGHQVSVVARGEVQSVMWEKSVTHFIVSIADDARLISCTVIAVADV